MTFAVAMDQYRGATFPLLRYLAVTERQPAATLVATQQGLVRRLLRHAYAHTAHYRAVMDDDGVSPESTDLARLPLLDRQTATDTVIARTATVSPRVAYSEPGEPVLRYTPESKAWRDAVRQRAYGWADVHRGMRVLELGVPQYWSRRDALKGRVERWLERRTAVAAGHDDDALGGLVAEIRRVRPQAIAGDVRALARFVEDHRLRAWDAIPAFVPCAVTTDERAAIERAFGKVFVMMAPRELSVIASECELHGGVHVAMESVVLELVVRDGGGVRAATPGEIGEVAVTDLHNLACPLVRYLTGARAVARTGTCGCGRGLDRIDWVQ